MGKTIGIIKKECKGLTVKQLKDQAKERGIKGYSKLRKAELCNVLLKDGWKKSSTKKSPAKKVSKKSPAKKSQKMRLDKDKYGNLNKLKKEINTIIYMGERETDRAELQKLKRKMRHTLLDYELASSARGKKPLKSYVDKAKNFMAY